MKNKYKVVALVPLEFSVEGNSDSKEAIESVKNIFKACRDDNDYADIVFDGIEESLRHDSIEYKVEAAQPEPEVKANSDIRSVASDICDIFENYLDENGVCIVCDDADEEQDRKSKRKRRNVVWHGILASCRRCRVPCEAYKCTIQAVHRL